MPGLAAAQQVGGLYDIEGTNDATCEIICMQNGNAFSAGYILGDAIGLLIYEVMDDGSLQGIWTVAGQDGTGTEILKPR